MSRTRRGQGHEGGGPRAVWLKDGGGAAGQHSSFLLLQHLSSSSSSSFVSS
jgi:hypothetical protein